MKRVLALDFGSKRIGVAVSDALNIIAQSVGAIDRQSVKNDIKKIGAFIKEYDAGKIVIGLPLNMDGSEGRSAGLATAFANELRKEISIEIEMIDERLTTAQGEKVLLEADVSRSKRKKNIDKIAAQLILQSYLDSHKNV